VREVSKNSKLIFRGIWVPDVIDDDRATYTWTFNSFSRSVQGVMWVLDFYAVEETGDPATAELAWRDQHILIYVARFFAQSSVWAFPVQFFSSGIASEVEKEVVVPPFVHYVYETWGDGCVEISSTQAPEARAAILAEIERRWEISFAEEAPLLLELLKGEGSRLYRGLQRDLRVTVRFVSSIEPAEPLLRLLEAAHQPPEKTLLAFPPVPGVPEGPAQHIFGAGTDADQRWTFGAEYAIAGVVPGRIHKPLSTEVEQTSPPAIEAEYLWA